MADTFRSSNPTLGEARFEAAAQEARASGVATMGDTMTVQGTVTKTIMLMGLLLCTASLSWYQMAHKLPLAVPLLIGGLVVGLIACLVCCFSPKSSPIAAPVYALAEGLFLGAISAMFAAKYEGIVTQAVSLTMLTCAAMLLLYKMRIIRATEKFKAVMFVAICSIAVFYLVLMVMRLFGGDVSAVTNSSPLSIGISVVVVGVAALSLILDFDQIESGEQTGAPRYMEWYGAFGLMVTLIWLYIEILKLLAKLKER